MEKNLFKSFIIPNATKILLSKPKAAVIQTLSAGNTKGGSITVLLTPCLTGLESAV
jgi:hypothetical protein